MAYQKNVVAGHGILLGKGTMAEVLAILAALGTLPRSQANGSTFHIEGDTAANNGTWIVMPTGLEKISNDVEAGTMDSFDIAVGSTSANISNGETINYAGAGVITPTINASTNTISYKVAATGADVGKVVKIDATGASVLAAENFVSIEDTFTLNLGLNDGVLSGLVITDTAKGVVSTTQGIAAKLSTDSRQELIFGTDGGLYVQNMVIDSASQSRLSYDQATNTLALTALGMTTVSVDTASTTVAAAYAAKAGQEGDVTILTQLQKVYIHNGGTAGTVADWTLIETPAMTDSAIRALFSASLGVQYNAATGAFAAKLRAIDSTHLNELKLDGNDLYVDVVNTSIVTNTKTSTLLQWIIDLNLTSGLAYDRVYENALTKTTDVNGLQTVKVGGNLTGATQIQLLNNNFDFASSGTGVLNVTTDNFAINHGFFVVNDAEEQVFMRLSSFNTWYVDTTAVYPN